MSSVIAVIFSLLTLLPSIVALSASTSPSNWHRLGLGRTVHVFSRNASSDLVVLTSLGVLARIDLQTSAIHWRILPPIPPPSNHASVYPLAAASLHPPLHHSTLLFVLLSDQSLRAIDPVSATVVWHYAPVCRFAVLPPDPVASIYFTSCLGRPPVLLDPSTGTPLTSSRTPPALLASNQSAIDAHYVNHFDLLAVKNIHLFWHIAPYTVISSPDGALRLCTELNDQNKQCAKHLWLREDGLAHVSSAAVFPFHSPSSPLVVVLSTLSTLFAVSESPNHSLSSSNENTIVRWKVDVDQSCFLLPALRDHAIVVCSACDATDLVCDTDSHVHRSTTVRAIRVSDGMVTFQQTKRGFGASRAALEPCRCDLCVIATDASAKSEHLFTSCTSNPTSSDNFDSTASPSTTHSTSASSSESESASSSSLPISSSSGFGWLVYSVGGKELRGVRNGVTTWQLRMPNDATISTIASYSYPMSSTSSSTTSILRRPAPVRVTSARQLMRKYVDEDTILVLAHDQAKGELHALIVDSATGSLYDAKVHSVANPPVSAVRGDHWFVYSFWNSAMLQHELQVVDMYDQAPPRNASSWVGHTVRAAVRALFGREIMSALGIPDPDFTVACRPAPGIQQDDTTPSSEGETERNINDSTTSGSTSSESNTDSSGSSGRSISVSDCSDEGHPCVTSEHNIDSSSDEIMQCTTAADISSTSELHHNEHFSDYRLFMDMVARRRASLSQYPTSLSSATSHSASSSVSSLFSFPSMSASSSSPYSSRTFHRKPMFIRSSMLLTKRITRLDVTQTTMGITQPAVIMTLENGQVTLVPKYLLDARNPGRRSPIRDSKLKQYEPVLFLESGSGRSTYIAEGAHVPGIKQIIVAPSNLRESSTLLAVLGIDIVFNVVQPAGSFDALAKEEFVYSGVLAMIVGLSASVLYTNRLKIRLSLKKSW